MKCLKVFYLKNKQTKIPIPSVIHYAVLLLFITKYICLDRIQYHVSLFEHQIMLCILANPLILQSRSISHIFFIYTNRQCLKIALVIVGVVKYKRVKEQPHLTAIFLTFELPKTIFGCLIEKETHIN